MKSPTSVVAFLLCFSTPFVRAADQTEFPSEIPPVTCQAVAEPPSGSESEWTFSLTMDIDTWNAIEPALPKLDWPEPTVKKPQPLVETATLTFHGISMSKLFNVVDRGGKPLDRDGILNHLKRETPVLLAFSGTMPPASYLRLPSHAELIVLLGQGKEREITPKVVADRLTEQPEELKGWTKEKSERFNSELNQKSKSFKIQGKQEPAKYLRGIWRMVKKAHVGGGHYVHADLGQDVSVICTDKWLMVRLAEPKGEKDMISSFGRIEIDPYDGLDVQVNHSMTFHRFQPIDETRMVVHAYDFYAVVQRVTSADASPSAENANHATPSPQPPSLQPPGTTEQDSDAVAAAKTHLGALLRADKAALTKSYAPTVHVLTKNETLERDQVIARATKMFGGGSESLATTLLRQLSFENLNVTEGELKVSSLAAIAAKDGELRFEIQPGDALVRISQGPAYWFVQLRKSEDQWVVVAEFVN